MSYLVAVEGADGAGKATAAKNVRNILLERGLKATVISFPRYRETVGGVCLGEFLSGRMPAQVTPQAAAVLYALDRLESRSMIEAAQRSNDLVIFDRYIASNVAYQAAKVAAHEVKAMMRWIVDLETDTFGLQRPNLNIYLDTPLETAMELMARKNVRPYTNVAFDKHEGDLGLQRRVRENYLDLAGDSLLSPWAIVVTVHAGKLRQPTDIATEIVTLIINDRNRHVKSRLASTLSQ
ncbi:MAG TPA: dTMP kinase [Stellaceae bacterium]|nr:dTMP kinase [Stellaceae bacterium]